MIVLTAHDRGTVLSVRAQPGARKNAILGERAGALRVAVSAAPERGKANEAIQALLAESLRIRPARITLLSGETSRDKRFLIDAMVPDQVRALLGERESGVGRRESSENE